MHRSLSNTIDYIEIPSRKLAETKHLFSALWLIVRRLRPGLCRLMKAEWLAATSPSGPINNECRSCSAVACAVVADYHMPRD